MSVFFLNRQLRVCLVLVLCFVVVLTGMPSQASAQQLTQRGITLSDDTPGATASEILTFRYTSTTTIGSVMLEYCTSPIDGVPCVAPAGIDASSALLTQQVGEGGFTIFNTTSNQIILSRTPAAPAPILSSYTFNNIVNPQAPAGTFYARVYTFASPDATGPNTDFGGIAASTAVSVPVTGIVPPILFFCVGITITGIDCSTATGNFIDLGELSPATVSSGTSQMVAATNGQGGLAIVADGTTMTSGNNIIPQLATPTVSAPGNAQFGLNLRANSNPQSGQDPSGPGVASPAAAYDVANRYTFNPGDVVASSNSVTNYRKFTATYVVNVPPSQAAGVYASTITYICTASF